MCTKHASIRPRKIKKWTMETVQEICFGVQWLTRKIFNFIMFAMPLWKVHLELKFHLCLATWYLGDMSEFSECWRRSTSIWWGVSESCWRRNISEEKILLSYGFNRPKKLLFSVRNRWTEIISVNTTVV